MVTAVIETATGQEDGVVPGIVGGRVSRIAAKEGEGVIEQSAVGFFVRLEVGEQLIELSEDACSISLSRAILLGSRP